MAHNVLSEVQNYLKQQKELFGDSFISCDELLMDEVPEEEMSKKKKTEIIESDLTVSKNIPEAWESSSDISTLKEQISGCLKCSLGKTRTNFVFGVGNPNADIMFIGEAPGADEDEKGEPFVGRAGQLLNKIIQAVEWKREDVFIANILKCRPPGNRDPLASEVELCENYLKKQIELIKPVMMVCLGRIAAQTLLRTKDSLTVLRSSIHSYHGVPLYVTFHPAALLRNPNWKPATWEDFKKIKSDYDNNPNKKLKK
jgi:uracil-DNA glycosylase